MWAQHLSMIFRAFAILNHPMQPAHARAMTHAVSAALRRYSVQEACNTLWSLALLRQLGPGLWGQILQHLRALLGPLESAAGGLQGENVFRITETISEAA